MNATEKTATQSIMDLCDSAGIEWRDYSGRGMYGDRCLAIVTDNPVDTVLCLVQEAIGSLDPEETAEIVEALSNSRTDSMGRSAVIYWPHLSDLPEHNDSDS